MVGLQSSKYVNISIECADTLHDYFELSFYTTRAPKTVLVQHYVPNLALEITRHNEVPEDKVINLQGFLVGKTPFTTIARCHSDFGSSSLIAQAIYSQSLQPTLTFLNWLRPTCRERMDGALNRQWRRCWLLVLACNHFSRHQRSAEEGMQFLQCWAPPGIWARTVWLRCKTKGELSTYSYQYCV